MILSPKLIVCDEAVSALDVSIQAQIIDLILALQAEFGMSLIFISHDLAVVRQVSHRVMVLFLGRVVELASRDDIYRDARHPYTKALISAVTIPDPKIERSKTRRLLTCELPSPLDSLPTDVPEIQTHRRSGRGEYVPKLLEVHHPQRRRARCDHRVAREAL